jgi:hypothetical protein
MAALRVRDAHGVEDLRLLFADVFIEDEDLYRFLVEGVQHIFGVDLALELDLVSRLTPVEMDDIDERRRQLVEIAGRVREKIPQMLWIAEGRTPWEVFREERFLGNTRVDLCSRVLKREFLRDHLDANFDPARDVVYLGIDWTEEHRFKRAQPRWEPWQLRAPLCERPLVNKAEMLAGLEELGIAPPRAYALGFPHNNCGGFCIKQGQAGFKLLLEAFPERYMWHAEQEVDIRELLGDVAILRDRTKEGRALHHPLDDWIYRDGEWEPPPVAPLPLIELARRVQDGTDATDPFDLGGCGCAL